MNRVGRAKEISNGNNGQMTLRRRWPNSKADLYAMEQANKVTQLHPTNKTSLGKVQGMF